MQFEGVARLELTLKELNENAWRENLQALIVSGWG